MMRFNSDGMVFLLDQKDGQYPDRIVSETVPFDAVKTAWRQFVIHVGAVAAEMKETEEKGGR